MNQNYKPVIYWNCFRFFKLKSKNEGITEPHEASEPQVADPDINC